MDERERHIEALIRREAALVGERYCFGADFSVSQAVSEYRGQVAAIHGVPIERVGAWYERGMLRAVVYEEAKD